MSAALRQKFTQRRTKSLWSKINTGHVARLHKLNKMKPAGLAAVAAAKSDGRWAAAYDSPGMVVIPKATQPEHVRDNRGALDLALDESDLAALDRAFPPPKGRTSLGML